MLGDITIGQYIDGNSFLHKMDPRAKIIGILLFMISLFSVNNFLGFGFIFMYAALIILISRVPFRFYIKGLKPLLFILIFTAAMQLFLTPGKIIWQWWIFSVSLEGMKLAIFMCSRLILLVLITSVLTLTTTPVMLTDAIEELLHPFRKIGVPAHELAMMMTIALRFIPTLLEETDKIIKAQTARGADFDSGGLLNRTKALLPVLVPLFLSAIKRADELALAMEARCYHGSEGRTRMRELKYTMIDGVAIFSAFIFLGVIILSRFVVLL